MVRAIVVSRSLALACWMARESQVSGVPCVHRAQERQEGAGPAGHQPMTLDAAAKMMSDEARARGGKVERGSPASRAMVRCARLAPPSGQGITDEPDRAHEGGVQAWGSVCACGGVRAAGAPCIPRTGCALCPHPSWRWIAACLRVQSEAVRQERERQHEQQFTAQQQHRLEQREEREARGVRPG